MRILVRKKKALKKHAGTRRGNERMRSPKGPAGTRAQLCVPVWMYRYMYEPVARFFSFNPFFSQKTSYRVPCLQSKRVCMILDLAEIAVKNLNVCHCHGCAVLRFCRSFRQ